MVVNKAKQNIVFSFLIIPSIVSFYGVKCHFVRRSTFSPGTTKFLSRIFKGRCSDYLDCTLPHTAQCDADPTRSQINCTTSLQLFIDAFAHKDPCAVSDDAYDEFLEEDMVHSEPNETLFWSGTKDVAINIATITDRYTTIERTAAGYVLNGLAWCGKVGSNNSSGINHVECPRCESGVPDATYQFWRSASRHFAGQARGFVSVILNSTRKGGAFQNKSTFATQELPNLNVELVNHVFIHIVRDVTIQEDIPGEDCNGQSIIYLERLLEEKGLGYTCYYNSREFILVQCVQYPDAAPCQMLSTSSVVFKGNSYLVSLFFVTLLINAIF